MALTAKELANMIGQPIEIRDKRTGATYTTTIDDARESFGSLQFMVKDGDSWFEPTTREAAGFAPKRDEVGK